MKENKIFLIIGVHGLVGEAIQKEIDRKFPWVGTAFRNVSTDRIALDITNPSDVARVIEKIKPAYVIHAANLAGGVKFCEKNPEQARKFHYEATQTIGREALRAKAKLIFISSECVFDGKKDIYQEKDEVNPVNVYGRWKAESEQWLIGHLKNCLIVRTMSVFGWQPQTKTPNAIMSAYFAISQKQNLSVPVYRWGSPTYVQDLAKAVVELSLDNAGGIFHVTGSTFLNRYEWLKKACDHLNWDSSFLKPKDKTSLDGIPYPARVKLDTTKFSKSYTTKLNSLDEALKLLYKDIYSLK